MYNIPDINTIRETTNKAINENVKKREEDFCDLIQTINERIESASLLGENYCTITDLKLCPLSLRDIKKIYSENGYTVEENYNCIHLKKEIIVSWEES